MVERLEIKRGILEWAVTRCGQSVEQFAKKNPSFAKWIEGEKQPTLRQLEEFSKKCYIPLGYLFMGEPRIETCPIPMFRSTSDHISLNTLDTIRVIQERQEWLSTYLVSNQIEIPNYVGRYNNVHDPEQVANAIYEILNLDPSWSISRQTVEEAIKYLTVQIENAGTLVCFNSMVGNNVHRPIEVSECRGFALIDNNAPFIFVNGKDAKVAQIFTLVHEFAHVLKGYSAGIGDMESIATSSDQERFCDKVAELFLLPENLFRKYWTGDNKESYGLMVRRFKVSRYTIARRAVELGLISRARMFELYNDWNNEPNEIRASSGHPDFARVALRRNSPTFMIHLNNALNSHQILHLEAYRLSGLKGDSYHNVVKSPAFIGL